MPPERISGYNPADFPPFAVTVDVVVLTVTPEGLGTVLIRRGKAPYAGAYALPGGFVLPDEDLADAAARELREETGVRLRPAELHQIGAFGAPDRDPRMRVVSVAYMAAVPDLPTPRGGSDAASAELCTLDPGRPSRRYLNLAFDHHEILDAAVRHLARLVEETPEATRFCPRTFTLADLRHVYEAIWGTELDPANFRKRVLRSEGFVEPVGEKRLPSPGLGRLAETYRRGPARELVPPLRRPGTYFHE